MADLESKVAEEEFSPGGDLELYLSAALALLLGLMYTAFGLANLFGQLLGPKGKIFIFEMDEVDNGTFVLETFLSQCCSFQVMGGLLGSPNYSKLEAILLFLGAVGAFLCWSSQVLLTQCLDTFPRPPSVLLPFSVFLLEPSTWPSACPTASTPTNLCPPSSFPSLLTLPFLYGAVSASSTPATKSRSLSVVLSAWFSPSYPTSS